MKRLFLAADIHSAACERIERIVGELKARLRADHRSKDEKITWVAPQNLHITLHFLGAVDDERSAALRDALTKPLPMASFELTVGGLGAFPLSGSPRVIWIGVTGGADRLRAVYRLLAARLSAAGQPLEARPFHAHLTLARIRSHVPPLTEILSGIDAAVETPTLIEHVTLYQSHVSPSGPTYEPIVRVPLVAE